MTERVQDVARVATGTAFLALALFASSCGGQTEPAGPECGNARCNSTEYCADPNCGICLPPGSVLIHHEFETCMCGGVECPALNDLKSNSCCLSDYACGVAIGDAGCAPIMVPADGSSSG